jgi:hypothetical protein
MNAHLYKERKGGPPVYGYAAALEEAAPYLQVGYAGGSALYEAGSAAYNGECQ